MRPAPEHQTVEHLNHHPRPVRLGNAPRQVLDGIELSVRLFVALLKRRNDGFAAKGLPTEQVLARRVEHLRGIVKAARYKLVHEPHSEQLKVLFRHRPGAYHDRETLGHGPRHAGYGEELCAEKVRSESALGRGSLICRTETARPC